MCQLLVCFCWFWRPAIIDRALNIDHGIDDDDDGDKADDDADEMRRRNIENGLGSSSRLELDGLMVKLVDDADGFRKRKIGNIWRRTAADRALHWPHSL